MANILQIKRSIATAAPQTLADGELAFTNNKDILFIGGIENGLPTVKQIAGSGAYLPITGGTLDGSLTIKQNLIVEGTTTTINSNVVDIGDAIIKLNSDLPVDVAPSENAGFEVARGSEDNAFWIWDETQRAFTGRVGAVKASLTDLFNVAIDGEFLGNALAVDTTAVVGTDLTVLESANVGTTLTTGGKITGNGGMAITGSTLFSGNTTISAGNFISRGIEDTATANQLNITNAATTIKNDVTLNETLTVNKTSSFRQGASFEDGITVKNQLNLAHLVIENNTLRANGVDATTVKLPNVDVNGGNIDSTTIGAATAAAGTFTTLTATDAFKSRGIQDDATSVRLLLDDATTTVKNSAKFNGNVVMDQALTLTGAGTFSDNLSVAKNFVVNMLTTLTGDVQLGANLAGAGVDSSNISGFTIDGGTF